MDFPRPRALRIVVADDDRDTVRTLVLLLRSEGHRVRSLYGSSDILSTVIDFHADVVLIDIAMPGMSGHEVARRIRAHYGGKGPRLVGVSGCYRERFDSNLAALNGFNHYLTKPYEPRALLALMKR